MFRAAIAGRLLFWCAAVMLLAGCSSPAATFRISPLRSKDTFGQDFSQAYITRETGGDYQIALLADPVDTVDLGRPDQPLKESHVSPLRQIVLIRVLWRPMKGARFDYPVASNSVIHWYIFDRTATDAGWIHYAGNAFVAVYPQSTRASIEIRNSSITMVERSGRLIDPLGPSGIRSNFDATSDDYRVQLLQNEARSLRPLPAPTSQPDTMPANQPPARESTP